MQYRSARRSFFLPALVFGAAACAVPLHAQPEDAAGCKDHPLFTRLPNFHIVECEQTQFERKLFPVGPINPNDEGAEAKSTPVEGAFQYIRFELNEGATKPSPLQIMRNFQAAAKKAGAAILAEYPGWCKAAVHESLHKGNNCILYGLTIKFTRQKQETWVFVESDHDGEAYEIWSVDREAMKQDISATQLSEQLSKEGFVTLHINFDTASAAIQPDSLPQLEEVAQMLKDAPDLKLEVGGHTDNVGTPDANLKLSDARAKAVMAALVKQGVAATRLTAKGYGQTMPVADNRTEEGRAKNRRVELTKK